MRKRYRNVSHEHNRHGKAVFYFRAGGGPKIRLPDDYGSPAFIEVLALARTGGAAIPRSSTVRPSFRRSQKRNVDGTLSRAVKSAKGRAIAAGVAYDIDKQWALELAELQGFKCALTGIPFYMTGSYGSHRHPFLPSLDRIVAGGGYTQDNVRIVVFAVNVMLMDWGIDIFERVANGYRYHKNKKSISISPPLDKGGEMTEKTLQ